MRSKYYLKRTKQGLHWWSVLQSLSHDQLFVSPWTAAHQASLSFTISLSLLKLTSTESTIQPFYPLSLPSSPALNLSQHQGSLSFNW